MRRSQSYRNQYIDLLCKSIDWFLFGKDVRYERVNVKELLQAMKGLSIIRHNSKHFSARQQKLNLKLSFETQSFRQNKFEASKTIFFVRVCHGKAFKIMKFSSKIIM